MHEVPHKACQAGHEVIGRDSCHSYQKPNLKSKIDSADSRRLMHCFCEFCNSLSFLPFLSLVFVSTFP